MPEALTQGLIYIIPKEDDSLEDIQKWQPITILNTAYKILTKALRQQVKVLLPKIIHATETGFIIERSILDNIFAFS